MNQALSCKLCDKVFTGQCPLQQHLASEKHKKKVAQQTYSQGCVAVPQKTDTSNELRPKLIDCKYDSDISNKVSAAPTFFSGAFQGAVKNNPFYCEACDITCSGPQPFEQHINSAKHIKKANIKHSTILQSNILSSSNGEISSHKIRCDLCGIDFFSIESHNAHQTEEKHIQRKKQLQKIVGDIGSVSFQCKPCGKIFTGEIPYIAHLQSKGHNKKIPMSDYLKSDDSNDTNSDDMEVEYMVSDNSNAFQKEMKVYDIPDLELEVFDLEEKVTFNSRKQ